MTRSKRVCVAGLLAAAAIGTPGLRAQSSSTAGTQSPSGGAARSADARKLERGKYLATIGACNDCHSPKIDAQMTPDPKRPFSGRPQTTFAPSQGANEIHASLDLTAWAGPWGVSYGANLTPDPETGIGTRYTEASFLKTLRTGKKPEGEDSAAPDAVGALQGDERRRHQGALRLPADASADQEQRTERRTATQAGRAHQEVRCGWRRCEWLMADG